MSKRDNGTWGDDYDVGYGKPPKETRFKPGQSGNPKGRPKARTSAGAVFERAHQERVIVSENGKRQSITKLEAVFKQMTNKAAAGDAKARQHVIALLQLYGGTETAHDPNSLIDPHTDEKLFQGLLERYSKHAQRAPGDGGKGSMPNAPEIDTPAGDDDDPDLC